MTVLRIILLLSFLMVSHLSIARNAPTPLFRDPITDGAADPVVIWNHKEKSWWILYTQRRANQETPGVSYCYGTPIGIASSKDNGATWAYRGTLKLDFEPGHNTFWAPDVIYDKGEYHMFVTYIQGVYSNWSGGAQIVHYTSKDLWNWEYKGVTKLANESIIDSSAMQMPDKSWKMFYKGRDSQIFSAESKDLFKWDNIKPVLTDSAQEGPIIFKFGEYYWLIVDEWQGMRVYRSKDAVAWEKQEERILSKASGRRDDGPSGAHGDVVVVNDKAYIFYFTHPDRDKHSNDRREANDNVPYALRRSGIQVAELVFENGKLIAKQNDFEFFLPNQN